MTMVVETQVPEQGTFFLHIHTTIDIKVSASKAQHDVTQYVHLYISSQMHGEIPTLILRQRAYWRVPVHLTFPAFGDVGEVGGIEVDVETGEMCINETVIGEIERHAEDLARRITSPAAG